MRMALYKEKKINVAFKYLSERPSYGRLNIKQEAIPGDTMRVRLVMTLTYSGDLI